MDLSGGLYFYPVLLSQLPQSISKATDTSLNKPATKVSLNVGDDSEGCRSLLRVTAIVGGKTLKKLLEMGVGVKVAGGGGEGAKGTHGGQESQKRKKKWIEHLFPKFRRIAL